MFQRDMMTDGSHSGYVNIPGLIRRESSAGIAEYPSMFPQIDPDIYKSRPNWGDLNQHEEFKRKEASKQFEELITKHFKKSTKTPFEEMIDLLFQPVEKIDFLVSLGWISTDYSGKPMVIKKDENGKVILTGEVDQTFLYEITIKFKNLLLAKPKLTVKI